MTRSNAPDAPPLLFAYPDHALVDKPLPKTRIFAHARPARKTREAITAHIARITWQYKLAPQTLNLPAKRSAPEIHIIRIELKPGLTSLGDDALRCLDKAIPFPLIFEQLTDAGALRMVAAYKRPSEADAAKWVVSDYFAGAWTPQDTARKPLPVALDLASLYQQILGCLIPTPARSGESLLARVERAQQLRQLQNQSRQLEQRVHREKQFNRRVELNSQLRQLNAEIRQQSQ